MLKHEFYRFILAGGIAAAVNFLSRILLNYMVSYRIAIVIAYLIGMLTAFLIMKYYVFRLDGRHSSTQVGSFILVNIVAVIQVWLVSVYLAEHLFPSISFTFYAKEVAHIIGLGLPILTSYLAHKYITFKQQGVGT